jgi:hypothetical protein
MSAAMLWGFLERDEDRYPEVTVIGAGTRVRRGIRVHRTAELADRDRRRIRGIPLTSPARTLLDIAVRLDGRPLRSAVRRAQGTGSANVRQICEMIARLGPRKGSRRLAMIIAEGPAPTRTVLEDVVLDLLLAGGFARPDVTSRCVSRAVAWSPTSAGLSIDSSSRPTAERGTTASSRARTTRSARPYWRPAASGSCG